MFRFSKNIFYPFITLVVDNQLHRVGYIGGGGEAYGKEESGRRSQSGYGQIGKELECHAEGLVLIQQKWKAMGKMQVGVQTGSHYPEIPTVKP